MTDLLAAVRQLQELQGKATPGPWEHDVTYEGEDPVIYTPRVLEGTGETYARVLFEGDWASREDAELIVAAVNLVGPLIEDWLRLRTVEEIPEFVCAHGHRWRCQDSTRCPRCGTSTFALAAALALPGGEE